MCFYIYTYIYVSRILDLPAKSSHFSLFFQELSLDADLAMHTTLARSCEARSAGRSWVSYGGLMGIYRGKLWKNYGILWWFFMVVFHGGFMGFYGISWVFMGFTYPLVMIVTYLLS